MFQFAWYMIRFAGYLFISVLAGLFGFFMILEFFFDIRKINGRNVIRNVLCFLLLGTAVLAGGYQFVKEFFTNMLPLWIGYGIVFPVLLVIMIGRVKKKNRTVLGYSGARSHITLPDGTTTIAESIQA